ncbi:YceI family protein [Thalassotalea atypica]|uniref:YceI family protein n=1 Tax=Thalassotalea atypica TaxID=2054316 RepID=UPI00257435F1|nr:YceI family protein [Thalassotalea atypica]
MKKTLLAALFASTLALPVVAAEYVIDHKGAHASVNFKVKHLGYSWLTGRFNTFSGDFSYDEKNISASKINIVIETASVDSNHAERDKHLKSDDFLDVKKFDNATFTSTKVEDLGNNKLKITGDFTLQGITKSLVIDAYKVGEGDDPWGGYRAGFSGTAKISMKDFGYKMNFGDILFDLHIEGVRK